MGRYFATALLSLSLVSPLSQADSDTPCPEFLDMEVRQLHSSKTHNLCDFYRQDAPLLIVNTASNCGFTGQFADLEALHQKYHQRGLVVLGFPSNSFRQEEAEEADTARVCFENFGVTFPMFEHLDVVGENAHPLFQYLAQQSQAPRWNFNKYLLLGDKVQHFGSGMKPLDSELEEQILMSF